MRRKARRRGGEEAPQGQPWGAEGWYRLFLEGGEPEAWLCVAEDLIRRGEQDGSEEDWELALRCLDYLEWEVGREPLWQERLQRLYRRLSSALALRQSSGTWRLKSLVREVELRKRRGEEWVSREEGWRYRRELEEQVWLPSLTCWLLWEEYCRRFEDVEERLFRLERLLQELGRPVNWLGLGQRFWQRVQRAEVQARWESLIRHLVARLSASLVREVPGQEPLQEWYGTVKTIDGALRLEDVLYTARRAVEDWAGAAEVHLARYEPPEVPPSTHRLPSLQDVVEEIPRVESPQEGRRLVEMAANILRSAREATDRSRERRSWWNWCRLNIERLHEVVFLIPHPVERAIAIIRCAEAEALWMVRGGLNTYRSAFRLARSLRDVETRSQLQRQGIVSLMQFGGWYGMEALRLALQEARHIAVGAERGEALGAIACALSRHEGVEVLNLWAELVHLLQGLLLSREGSQVSKVILACWCRWLQKVEDRILHREAPPFPEGERLIHRLLRLAEQRLPNLWRPVPYLLALALIESIVEAHLLPQPRWRSVLRRHHQMVRILERRRSEILLQSFRDSAP